MQAAIIEAGALPALTALLERAQPDGQYAAAAALYNLAGQEPEVRQALVTQGALPHLVQMLHAESWYPSSCCTALLKSHVFPFSCALCACVCVCVHAFVRVCVRVSGGGGGGGGLVCKLAAITSCWSCCCTNPFWLLLLCKGGLCTQVVVDVCRYCRIVAAEVLGRVSMEWGNRAAIEQAGAVDPLINLLRLNHSPGVMSHPLCKHDCFTRPASLTACLDSQNSRQPTCCSRCASMQIQTPAVR